MKIRVTSGAYEYQGLYKDSLHEVERVVVDGFLGTGYRFKANGKLWEIFEPECEVVREECRSSYCECEEGKCSGGKIDMRTDEVNKIKSKADSEKKAPIKSDGGSSSYYDIYLPTWLMQAMVDREVDGKVYIKTEELIEVAFESDFDFANAFKSLVRAFGTMNGGGKAGNDVDYEMNKVQYSANKIKERNKRNGENK